MAKISRITEKTKTDCFGFEKQKCNVLTERVCDHRKCSFYKTMEEYRKSFKELDLKLYNGGR